MGFAKYHEDNMEMWHERQRDRRVPVYIGSSQIETSKSQQKSSSILSGKDFSALDRVNHRIIVQHF